MFFYTTIYTRRSIWNFHLGFSKAMEEKFSNFGCLCTVLNRLLDIGLKNWLVHLHSAGFANLVMIILFVYILFLVHFFLFSSLCGWSDHYWKWSYLSSEIQSPFKLMFSYEEFGPAKILSWNRSCLDQTWYLPLLVKVCLRYLIWCRIRWWQATYLSYETESLGWKG